MTNPIIDLSTNTNPDRLQIQRRGAIDISLSEFDVSASMLSGSLPLNAITLNYPKQKIVLLDDNDAVTGGDVYYTPVYSERIKYDVWKTTVNKTFDELEV